jgi:hypothetical protein
VELLLFVFDKESPVLTADSLRDLDDAVARLGGPVLREFDRMRIRLRELEYELASVRDVPSVSGKQGVAVDPGGPSTAKAGHLHSQRGV